MQNKALQIDQLLRMKYKQEASRLDDRVLSAPFQNVPYFAVMINCRLK